MLNKKHVDLSQVSRHVICFQGPLQPSPVTGRLEPWQPAWQRHIYRYFISVPIIAVCLCAVFCVMIISLQVQVSSNSISINRRRRNFFRNLIRTFPLRQDWWDAQLRIRGFPAWLGYFPKIMLAIVITLMDEAYFKIAIWLNDKGNYVKVYLWFLFRHHCMGILFFL